MSYIPSPGIGWRGEDLSGVLQASLQGKNRHIPRFRSDKLEP